MRARMAARPRTCSSKRARSTAAATSTCCRSPTWASPTGIAGCRDDWIFTEALFPGHARRSGRHPAADGRGRRLSREEPADQGAHRRLDLQEPARPQRLEADRRGGLPRLPRRRREGVGDALQLPHQRRQAPAPRTSSGWARRCARASRRASGIELEWEIIRIGQPLPGRPRAKRWSREHGHERSEGAAAHARHVAVLMGGWSAEREVSLRSGAAVRRGAGGRGLSRHPHRRRPRSRRAARGAQARRLLQRAARPVRRGRLRTGHPGMPAASPTRIRACSPRRWRCTRSAPRTCMAAAGVPVAEAVIVTRARGRCSATSWRRPTSSSRSRKAPASASSSCEDRRQPSAGSDRTRAALPTTRSWSSATSPAAS